MRKVKLEIQYDGEPFYGSQKQPNHVSIQSTIESALARIYNRSVLVQFAGRTDRGVHAIGQVVTFEDDNKIPLSKLPSVINAQLIDRIEVTGVSVVDRQFSVRHSACRRIYQYWLYTGQRSLFLDRYMVHVPAVDAQKLSVAAAAFLGKRDFAAVCARPSQYKSTIRTIHTSEWQNDSYRQLGLEGEAWIYTIEAESFMQHMVRKIVGLQLQFHQDLINLQQLNDILSRKQSHVWEMAPGRGLFLQQVQYK